MHETPNTTSRPAGGRNAAQPTVSLGLPSGRDVVSPWARTLRRRNGVEQYTRDIIDAFRVVGANVIRLKPDKKMSVGMWAHKNRGQRVFDHHGVWTATLAGCQWGVGTAATDIWGGLTVVDIDVLDDATMAWAAAYLPPTPLVVYSSRGVHCYYRSVPGATTHVGSMGPVGGDGKRHVDYKAGPGLVVGAGSHNAAKDWTYRASVEITPELLRSLPVFDGGPEITAAARSAVAVPVVRGDLTGMSFRLGDGRVVDGREVPTKWTPVYCPCHPDNRNTPHANAKRVAAGIQVRCFLDNRTVLFRPAPPLQGETAADIITPEVLADLSRPAAKEVESPRGMFRKAYWDNHIRTNRLCLGREQVLVGDGKIMHAKRRCGKRSCLWCGPHDLAVTSRLLFRAFTDEQVYEYSIQKKDFEAWTKAAKRNSVGICTKPLTGGGSPYTDTIPTILKWVAFDDGEDALRVYANVTTTRISKRRPPRDWHPVAVEHVSWASLLLDDLSFTRKDGKRHVSMSMRTSDSVPTELPRDSEWSVMMSDVGAGTFLAAAEAHKMDVTARDARTPDAAADFDNDPKWASLAVQCRDPGLAAQFHLSLVGEATPQDNTDSFALVSHILDGTMPEEECTPASLPAMGAGTPPEWRVPPVPYFPDLPDSFEAAVADLIAILDDLPAPVESPSTEV